MTDVIVWDDVLTDLARALADAFAGSEQEAVAVGGRHSITLGSASLGGSSLSTWQALFSHRRREKLLEVLRDIYQTYPQVRDEALAALRRHQPTTIELYARCEGIEKHIPTMRRTKHLGLGALTKVENEVAALYTVRAVGLEHHRSMAETDVAEQLSVDILQRLKDLLDQASEALQVYREYVGRLQERRDIDWMTGLTGRSVREEAIASKLRLADRLEALAEFRHSAQDE